MYTPCAEDQISMLARGVAELFSIGFAVCWRMACWFGGIGMDLQEWSNGYCSFLCGSSACAGGFVSWKKCVLVKGTIVCGGCKRSFATRDRSDVSHRSISKNSICTAFLFKVEDHRIVPGFVEKPQHNSMIFLQEKQLNSWMFRGLLWTDSFFADSCCVSQQLLGSGLHCHQLPIKGNIIWKWPSMVWYKAESKMSYSELLKPGVACHLLVKKRISWTWPGVVISPQKY